MNAESVNSLQHTSTTRTIGCCYCSPTPSGRNALHCITQSAPQTHQPLPQRLCPALILFQRHRQPLPWVPWGHACATWACVLQGSMVKCSCQLPRIYDSFRTACCCVGTHDTRCVCVVVGCFVGWSCMHVASCTCVCVCFFIQHTTNKTAIWCSTCSSIISIILITSNGCCCCCCHMLLPIGPPWCRCCCDKCPSL